MEILTLAPGYRKNTKYNATPLNRTPSGLRKKFGLEGFWFREVPYIRLCSHYRLLWQPYCSHHKKKRQMFQLILSPYDFTLQSKKGTRLIRGLKQNITDFKQKLGPRLIGGSPYRRVRMVRQKFGMTKSFSLEGFLVWRGSGLEGFHCTVIFLILVW